MPRLVTPFIACALATNAFAQLGDDPQYRRKAPSFALQDQYEKTHTFTYPQEKPLVLSIGDQASADDALDWKEAILKKYDDRIRYVPIANLAELPTVLRGAVRLAMRTVEKDPVLCDWDGTVSKSYGARKNVVNIIIVSPGGHILHRAHGKISDAKRSAFFIALENQEKAAKDSSIQASPEDDQKET